jgi:hypothetical protein
VLYDRRDGRTVLYKIGAVGMERMKNERCYKSGGNRERCCTSGWKDERELCEWKENMVLYGRAGGRAVLCV